MDSPSLNLYSHQKMSAEQYLKKALEQKQQLAANLQSPTRLAAVDNLARLLMDAMDEYGSTDDIRNSVWDECALFNNENTYSYAEREMFWGAAGAHHYPASEEEAGDLFCGTAAMERLKCLAQWKFPESSAAGISAESLGNDLTFVIAGWMYQAKSLVEKWVLSAPVEKQPQLWQEIIAEASRHELSPYRQVAINLVLEGWEEYLEKTDPVSKKFGELHKTRTKRTSNYRDKVLPEVQAAFEHSRQHEAENGPLVK